MVRPCATVPRWWSRSDCRRVYRVCWSTRCGTCCAVDLVSNWIHAVRTGLSSACWMLKQAPVGTTRQVGPTRPPPALGNASTDSLTASLGIAAPVDQPPTATPRRLARPIRRWSPNRSIQPKQFDEDEAGTKNRPTSRSRLISEPGLSTKQCRSVNGQEARKMLGYSPTLLKNLEQICRPRPGTILNKSVFTGPGLGTRCGEPILARQLGEQCTFSS